MKGLKTYKINVSMLSNEGKRDVLNKLVSLGYEKWSKDWTPENTNNVGYFITYAPPEHIEWNPLVSWNVGKYRYMDVLTVDQLYKTVEEKESVVSDTNKLISNTEALRALVDGKEIQWISNSFQDWNNLDKGNTYLKTLLDENYIRECGFKFRLKPQTITINGIEVPAPFKPKVGEEYFYIQSSKDGYAKSRFISEYCDQHFLYFGAWRTKEEIKQVVAGLHKALGGDV